ncbi:MAG: 4-oxalocrotonate tautomerase family protein [Treponema sp.]|nr:4-oxalocrotonate tautomerase family protein [Treponema sp.]
MPLVKVNILEGKSPEFKKTIFDCIHQGLIDAYAITRSEWEKFKKDNEVSK